MPREKQSRPNIARIPPPQCLLHPTSGISMVSVAVVAAGYILPPIRCKNTPASATNAFGRETWEEGMGLAVGASALRGVRTTGEKANGGSTP